MTMQHGDPCYCVFVGSTLRNIGVNCNQPQSEEDKTMIDQVSSDTSSNSDDSDLPDDRMCDDSLPEVVLTDENDSGRGSDDKTEKDEDTDVDTDVDDDDVPDDEDDDSDDEDDSDEE